MNCFFLEGKLIRQAFGLSYSFMVVSFFTIVMSISLDNHLVIREFGLSYSFKVFAYSL